MDWRDFAMIVLSALGAVLSGVATALWSQISSTRERITDLERHVSETYARRDHLDTVSGQILHEIRSLRELVISTIRGPKG